MKLNTPKGTRDFSPTEMVRRNYIFDTVKSVFKKYGYQPIETPSMENSETLMGKYGDEGDRLIFKILNSGDFLEKVDSEQIAKGGLQQLSDRLFYTETLDVIKDSLVGHIEEKLSQLTTGQPVSWKRGDYWFDWSKLVGANMDKSLLLNLESAYIQHLLKEFQAGTPDGISLGSRLEFYRSSLSNREVYADLVRSEFENFIRYDSLALRLQAIFGAIPTNQFTKQISEKALRYDLTVPFARYVVQHRNEITFPFKRYQVQPVWRADRPQKGRYREFYQCDIDVIGSNSLLNEVEMVQVTDEVFSKLNIPVTVKINNRKLLAAIAEVIGAPDAFVDITVALDKLDKIGEDKVCTELITRSISEASIDKLLPLMRFQGNTIEKLEFLKTYLGENETGQKGIAEVSEVLETAQKLISDKTILELDLTLARGLNYYTGAIFEVQSRIEGTLSSSISGGGRYDDLTGIFGMKDVSGVGISFGADRIYDVIEAANLFPEFTSDSTQVFFVNFGKEEANHCLGLVKQLREAGINTELYPDNAKMKKQMTYAHNNGIQFVAMVGSDEIESGKIGVKNMTTGEQSSVTANELITLVNG
jgi:histidyl-tRNA synthetase